MAWTCVRCQKRIFAPRKNALRYAMRWKYVKSRNELQVELRNLKDLKDNNVITHASCPLEEAEGFPVRMKKALGVPDNVDHPLLS